MLKPQLAVDTKFTDMTFPKMAFPKIDGVRGCHLTGSFTGRSLKPLGNRCLTERFSDPFYEGMDGELTLDGRITGDELCNMTTSAVMRHAGDPLIYWNLFDYLAPHTANLPYIDRYNALCAHVSMGHVSAIYGHYLKVIPYTFITDAEQAEAFYNDCLDQEYEGAIFRDPCAMHKSGRATAKLQDFWRAKPASDKDAIVLRLEEGRTNNNEAMTNPLGRTERSTNAENMAPNGMIGTLICRDVLSGMEIRVSPGKMKHDERISLLGQPDLIVGQAIKYRSLDTGVVEAPRQARYISRRAIADLAAA